MKHIDNNRTRDDSLFGLLSVNKARTVYLRVLVNESEDSIVVQLTDNPSSWLKYTDERFAHHRVLRRLELGVVRSSIKYLTPDDIIDYYGPRLGIHIDDRQMLVVSTMKKSGIHTLETSLRYRAKVVVAVRKLLNLSPQKKCEILEKKFSDDQE